MNKINVKYDVVIAVSLYLLVTLLFFAPCLKYLNSYLIGPLEDNMQQFWDMWWFNKVIDSGHLEGLASSNYILYPEGESLLFHAFSYYNPSYLLSLVLRYFLSKVLIYNILILFTFILSGMGAYLLIKYLTGDSFSSFIGGFIFAFNPSHFVHSLHHLEISSIEFIPLFVLYFIKTIKNDSKKYLFLASLFFLLNSLCAWYYMMLAIFFMGFAYVYLAFKRKRLVLKDVFIKSFIIVFITILFFAPWLFKMIAAVLKKGVVLVPAYNVSVVDLFSLFIPHPYHLLSGVDIFKNINFRYTGSYWEYTSYLGIVNLIIIILSFKAIFSKTSRYFLGLLSFLILSMGTHLHILGWQSPIVLPYELLRHVPLLSHMRTPSRAIVYVYLFLAIIVAFAIKYLRNLEIYKKGKRRFYVITLISLLFFDYFSICQEGTRVALPQAYNVIKKEDKVFGILDLPTYDYIMHSRYMMYQTMHGFPIVGGWAARSLNPNALLYRIDKISDLDKQKEQLLESKVKYIIIHKYFIPAFYLEGGISLYKNHYRVIYEDKDNAVFQVY